MRKQKLKPGDLVRFTEVTKKHVLHDCSEPRYASPPPSVGDGHVCVPGDSIMVVINVDVLGFVSGGACVLWTPVGLIVEFADLVERVPD